MLAGACFSNEWLWSQELAIFPLFARLVYLFYYIFLELFSISSSYPSFIPLYPASDLSPPYPHHHLLLPLSSSITHYNLISLSPRPLISLLHSSLLLHHPSLSVLFYSSSFELSFRTSCTNMLSCIPYPPTPFGILGDLHFTSDMRLFAHTHLRISGPHVVSRCVARTMLTD